MSVVKKEGKLLINNKAASVRTPLQAGDEVVVSLGKEIADATPTAMPLQIVYEDDDILLINKAPQLVTHPTRYHQTDTLANGIYHHWQENGETGKVRFVNRLDMDTSGIVCIAKNKYVHHFIQQQMAQQKVKKLYWAIVEGELKKKNDIINAPICRNEADGILREVNLQGKACATAYMVLQYFPATNLSLVQIELLTGRTHQIRVHMRHIGHPVLGDGLYHEKSADIDRQALHASSIGFMHPRTKKYETFQAPIWEDMNQILMKN